MIATQETTQVPQAGVFAGRLTREKWLSGLGLGAVLLVAAVLNLWNLAQNGYGNTYYAAAVQSMTQNFHAFFYGSFDAGGFITVDKPPVALWVQAISAKLFGFSGLAILVPEALMGVAAVGLLYFLVKRLFGTPAGLLAALALALTPIAVAVNRDNNTDTLLMFTLLLAAWAMTLATEKGRLALLLVAMALVGVAFNVKMLEAFIVLPTFYLLYLVAAPLRWYTRLWHLTLAGVVLLAVALSWPLAVDLTPAADRPWVGGSTTNSVIQLALGYNGLGRVTGQEGGGRGGQFGNGAAPGGRVPDGGRNGGGPGGGMFGAGVAGPGRLFGSELADQWSWLIPLGGFGLVAGLVTLRRRLPLEPRGQALLLWSGWLATYAVVFSMAQGIFHTYYLVMLAPATAALVGISLFALWRTYRKGGWQTWLLPAALLATAAWQSKVLADYPQASLWLMPVAVGGSLIAAIPLIATRLLTTRVWRRVAPVLVSVALVALFVAPTLWSLTPVQAASNGVMPEAGVPAIPGQTATRQGFGGFGQGGPGAGGPGAASRSLIAYLEANQAGHFYLVAVASANEGAAITLQTGKPVLAMGGFTGSDPAMTVTKLQQMIAAGQIRFVMGANGAVSNWVQSACSAVDAGLYGGSSGGGGGFGGRGGNGTLYDCAAQ